MDNEEDFQEKEFYLNLSVDSDNEENEKKKESEKNEKIIINEIPKESEFFGMKLDPFPFSGRKYCKTCNKSSLMYCPYCMKPLKEYPPPTVNLPIPMEIIHHEKEKKVKSTAVQACVLCPKQAIMWEFPNIPEYNTEETLCLYPSDDAISIDEIDLNKFKKVVFIDCTWHQVYPICSDKRVQKLTKVKLKNHKTLFWRYQYASPEYLATIEAIYFFYKEFITKKNKGKYSGEMDNLLWYYVFQYEHIQQLHAYDIIKPSKRLSENYYRKNKNVIKNEKDRNKEKNYEKELKEDIKKNK